MIATDGSDSADAALDVAASVALVSEQPQVRVVHVWRLEVHHRHGIWDTELRRSAEKLLGHSVGRLCKLGVEADTELERSDELHVAPAIVEAARRFQADLAVVGSRVLSDWHALVQHGIGHNLMASLDCPLLAVRATAGSVAHQPKRVLLALGAHDDVESAVRAAAAAAHGDGSKVLVIDVAGEREHPAENARRTVDLAIDMLLESGISADGWVLRPGAVAEEVADAATRWSADVVAMGPARSGDVSSVLFESVTQELLRETAVPVMVAGGSQA